MAGRKSEEEHSGLPVGREYFPARTVIFEIDAFLQEFDVFLRSTYPEHSEEQLTGIRNFQVQIILEYFKGNSRRFLDMQGWLRERLLNLCNPAGADLPYLSDIRVLLQHEDSEKVIAHLEHQLQEIR